MMAGTDGDTFVVENRADFVRVHAVEREGKDGCLIACGTDQSQAGEKSGAAGRVVEKRPLVRGDGG